MPKVTAWQCPHTEKLFLHESDYRTHLNKLARKRIQERREAAIRAAFDQTIRDFQMSCFSFSDIWRWVEQNSHVIYSRKPKDERPRIVRIEFDDMRWSPSCSNTHNAPHGKPTNWHCEPNIPRGYPGWKGRVRYLIEKNVNGFHSEPLKRIGIHTGSGGSGNGLNYSYEVTIFAEEFENIAFKQRMDGLIQSKDLPG
jgi:hypothetical protein